MIRRLLPNAIAVASVTIAWPSVAAEEAVVSRLNNTDAGIFILAIAAALLITLLFRASASRLARTLTEKIGTRRLLGILRSHSTNVLDDFIVPGAYGGLTRVDHAILTPAGILCIQTKHYNGVVFGAPKEPQWTNVDGIHRRKFLNPLIQNEGRARALQKIAPDVPVAGLVVFTGAVQFTSLQEKNVVHVRDLERYISSFISESSETGEWGDVWMSVTAAALTDDDSRKDFDAQLSFS
ncbi:MAG: nuclease-related domain-containing protein [Woeseiaceae bacterium]